MTWRVNLFFAVVLVISRINPTTQVHNSATSSSDTNRTIILFPSPTRRFSTISTQFISSLSTKSASTQLHATSSYSARPQSTIVSSQPISSTRARPTPPRKAGFCEKYEGPPCQDVLQSSLLVFNKTKRYFDANYGINGTKLFLTQMLREYNRLVTDERCKRLIEVALCQYTLSPCTSDGRPISYCREDCQSLIKECEIYVNRLIGSAGVLTSLLGIDFSHLILPTNCSMYSSGRSGNRSCVYLGLFDHSQSPDSTSNQTVLWIIAGAGSFFIVFTIIIISCFCLRGKRLSDKKVVEEIVLGSVDTAVDPASSMKTKLSKIVELSSLSSKIAEMYDPKKLKEFSLDKIEYISDLGEGQFGLVFEGAARGIDEHEEASEQTVVAVKTLKKDCNKQSKEEFNQEVAFMSVLDHPNVLKLIAVATEEPQCMIFEFMEFGDLNQFLRKVKPLAETQDFPELQLSLKDFLSISNQIASGMAYLASLHVVHRDLATRNCLVGEGLVVKIADFGLARGIYSSDYYKVSGNAMLPVRWMPPEAILHGRFSVESDVYSYGVLMWEIFTFALQPFYGYTNEDVIIFARQGVLLGQPKECPNHIYKLMLDCWSRRPEKRPDFNSIMKRLAKDAPAAPNFSTPRSPSVNTDEHAQCEGLVPRSDVPKTGDESRFDAQERYCPVAGKVENHYMSPGAVSNAGFKTDKEEACKRATTTIPLIPKKQDNGFEGRYSNISAYSPGT